VIDRHLKPSPVPCTTDLDIPEEAVGGAVALRVGTVILRPSTTVEKLVVRVLLREGRSRS
jgi:hypothetical protein